MKNGMNMYFFDRVAHDTTAKTGKVKGITKPTANVVVIARLFTLNLKKLPMMWLCTSAEVHVNFYFEL
jgi:hypothetical protein